MTSATAIPRRQPMTAERVTAVITVLLFFLLYATRLTRGIGWYDSGEFVGVATTLGIAHPTGYPLYSLVGRLAATGLSFLSEAAFRENILSAALAAATTGLLVLVTARLAALLSLGPIPRGARLAALVMPSAVLGTLPLFMEQAVIAEVYTLHTALVALLLLLALEAVLQGERPYLPFEGDMAWREQARVWGPAGWRLPLLLAYTAGLGLGNHFTLVLYFPALLWLGWWSTRPEAWQPETVRVRSALGSFMRRALPVLALGIVGFSIYLLVPVRASQHPLFNWGSADSLGRFLRLITAAEARSRPAQFSPVTPLGIWGRMASGMGPVLLMTALAGWVWSGLRRRRLGIMALLYLAFPLLFLLWGLDILEDALLPVHLFIALGVGLFGILLAERLVARLGPQTGGWVAGAVAALLLVVGPIRVTAGEWGEIRIADEGGPADWIEAVTSSVAGSPAHGEDVRGWVFAEDNTTAFGLWHQSRTLQRYPNLRGIYLLLAREPWYQEELRRRVPSLMIPELPPEFREMPHDVAGRELLLANRGLGVPLYLSPVILPPEDVYGTLVPQGVLLRIEPLGYEPTQEDIQRHLALITAVSPARAQDLPHLDRQSRDWWSYRHKLLGDAWARLGSLPMAEAEYRASTRIAPERIETWAALGGFYAVISEWEEALGAWQRARAVAPHDAYVAFMVARALVNTGAPEEAAALLPDPPVPDVAMPEYLRARAALRSATSDLEGAESDLRAALAEDPSDGEAANDLGVVLLRRGDRDRAREAFRTATDTSPDLAEAWANLGTLEIQDGAWEAAADHLQRASEAGGTNPQIPYARALALYNLRRLGEAEQILRQSIQQAPRHAGSYLLLGAVLEAAGKRQEAVRTYEQGRMAVPEEPGFAAALRRLGVLPPG